MKRMIKAGEYLSEEEAEAYSIVNRSIENLQSVYESLDESLGFYNQFDKRAASFIMKGQSRIEDAIDRIRYGIEG